MTRRNGHENDFFSYQKRNTWTFCWKPFLGACPGAALIGREIDAAASASNYEP